MAMQSQEVFMLYCGIIPSVFAWSFTRNEYVAFLASLFYISLVTCPAEPFFHFFQNVFRQCQNVFLITQTQFDSLAKLRAFSSQLYRHFLIAAVVPHSSSSKSLLGPIFLHFWTISAYLSPSRTIPPPLFPCAIGLICLSCWRSATKRTSFQLSSANALVTQ